jgi:hypothetical protein
MQQRLDIYQKKVPRIIMSILPGLLSSLTNEECVEFLKDIYRTKPLTEQQLKTKISIEFAKALNQLDKDDTDSEDWWKILKDSTSQILKYRINYDEMPGPTRKAFYAISTMAMDTKNISTLDKFRRNSTAIMSIWSSTDESMILTRIDQTIPFLTCTFAMWSAFDQLMLLTKSEKYKDLTHEVLSRHKVEILETGITVG